VYTENNEVLPIVVGRERTRE